MKEKIQSPYPDNNCFFCGSENDDGLKLSFYWDSLKNKTHTEYLPAQHFVGQGNILHGGIQMGLLDEIMGWTSYVVCEKMAVTTDLNISFLQPLYINKDKIQATCHVVSRKDPKVTMEASLLDAKGMVCTTATGTFHILSAQKYNDLIQGSKE